MTGDPYAETVIIIMRITEHIVFLLNCKNILKHIADYGLENNMINLISSLVKDYFICNHPNHE